MAETVQTAAPAARSAFQGLALPGRHGMKDGTAGLVVAERTGFALVTLIARRDKATALAEAVRGSFGIALPDRPRLESAGAVSALWAGPGQWLLLAQPPAADGFPARVAAATAGLALAADQSDARGLLALSGPRVRDVLAKGIPVDLHPRAFRTGDVALTMAGHVDVTLWQEDETPAYVLAVARGFAGSLWHWLEESGAEFGIEVG